VAKYKEDRPSMRDMPLREVNTAHTDVLAAHAEEFLPTIRYLLLQGEGPVTPERLATAQRWTPAEVETVLRSADLSVDAEGAIQPMAGSGCALDTLLFPMLTGRSARVAATCPATGKPIRLTVTPPGGIEDLDPPGAVVSVRLPDPDTSARSAQGTICAYGHVFADREHASSWPALHPEAVLLSVADAARLAREIAATARGYAEAMAG
jgi:alkylmercury lyase